MYLWIRGKRINIYWNSHRFWNFKGRFSQKNNEVKIFLNNNLIEKTTFENFIKNINAFFNEIIPYLRKMIFVEIKEEGEDSPYVIILGKIYEWQEDFYDVIDSSNLWMIGFLIPFGLTKKPSLFIVSFPIIASIS